MVISAANKDAACYTDRAGKHITCIETCYNVYTLPYVCYKAERSTSVCALSRVQRHHACLADGSGALLQMRAQGSESTKRLRFHAGHDST